MAGTGQYSLTASNFVATTPATAVRIGAGVGIGACGSSETSTTTDKDGNVTTEEKESIKIP